MMDMTRLPRISLLVNFCFILAIWLDICYTISKTGPRPNRQLPTANRQLPTANCQPPTTNRQSFYHRNTPQKPAGETECEKYSESCACGDPGETGADLIWNRISKTLLAFLNSTDHF
jgi:hypothetical protein